MAAFEGSLPWAHVLGEPTHKPNSHLSVLLLTSVKKPAIPAWHEPCSSPYFFLYSGQEKERRTVVSFGHAGNKDATPPLHSRHVPHEFLHHPTCSLETAKGRMGYPTSITGGGMLWDTGVRETTTKATRKTHTSLKKNTLSSRPGGEEIMFHLADFFFLSTALKYLP